MRSQSLLRMLIAAGLGALSAFPAPGQVSGNAFAGTALNRSAVDLHPDRMAAFLKSGLDAQSPSSDRHDTGLKLSTAYRFGPRLGLEPDVYRLGEAGSRAGDERAAVLPKPVSVSATALFASNRATLSPVAQVMLDNFCVDISGLHFEHILVTGHADGLGDAGHNRRLAQQRSNEVKAYLVQACGLDAHQLLAAGSVGSTAQQPTATRPAECRHSMPSRKLSSCLQPDRSVEVFVIGRR